MIFPKPLVGVSHEVGYLSPICAVHFGAAIPRGCMAVTQSGNFSGGVVTALLVWGSDYY